MAAWQTRAYLPNDQKTGRAEGFLRKKSILNTPRPEWAKHIQPGATPWVQMKMCAPALKGRLRMLSLKNL
ncbi:MAG: hypothetical protein QF437_06470, partial [Planctomycetota bacterium]|nr:hypothetical protein [Planctomycetota bacterium]